MAVMHIVRVFNNKRIFGPERWGQIHNEEHYKPQSSPNIVRETSRMRRTTLRQSNPIHTWQHRFLTHLHLHINLSDTQYRDFKFLRTRSGYTYELRKIVKALLKSCKKNTYIIFFILIVLHLVLNPLKQDVWDKLCAIFVQLLLGDHTHFIFNFTQIELSACKPLRRMRNGDIPPFILMLGTTCRKLGGLRYQTGRFKRHKSNHDPSVVQPVT